jgi:hypothetical protein
LNSCTVKSALPYCPSKIWQQLLEIGIKSRKDWQSQNESESGSAFTGGALG